MSEVAELIALARRVGSTIPDAVSATLIAAGDLEAARIAVLDHAADADAACMVSPFHGAGAGDAQPTKPKRKGRAK